MKSSDPAGAALVAEALQRALIYRLLASAFLGPSEARLCELALGAATAAAAARGPLRERVAARPGGAGGGGGRGARAAGPRAARAAGGGGGPAPRPRRARLPLRPRGVLRPVGERVRRPRAPRRGVRAPGRRGGLLRDVRPAARRRAAPRGGPHRRRARVRERARVPRG